jgi:hypothetical protein
MIISKFSNSALRYRVLNADLNIAKKIKSEGLSEVILKSRFLEKMDSRCYKIQDISFSGEGAYKFCHKITFSNGRSSRSVSLLTSKTSYSMDDEYNFYEKHKNIQYFPEMFEYFNTEKNHCIHGARLKGRDCILREFIEKPAVACFIKDHQIMIAYVKAVRKLMDLGVNVERDMEVSNFYNAFYFPSTGDFKFIDIGAYVRPAEGMISRLIRRISSIDEVSYRQELTEIFLGHPKFDEYYGDTYQKILKYWEKLDQGIHSKRKSIEL